MPQTMDEPIEARTLPHSLDAEKAILGCILLHPDALDAVVDAKLEPGHFYRQAHQTIFRTMLRLAGAKAHSLDFLTLKEALLSAGKLDEVGGPAYLSALTDGMPRSAHMADYAALVREKAERRAIIFAANQLLAEAYGSQTETRDLIDTAEQHIFAIGQGDTRSGFTRLSDIMPKVLTQIEAWSQTKQGISGIATGFTDLDDMTRGFQPGNLIIIAARPSMGKSALVVNIAQHVAKQGQTAAVFSLEMSETELAVRTLTAEARMDGHRMQRGYIRESEWGSLNAAITRLCDLNLYIDESPFITALEMRSRARRLKAEHGLDLLIVDYTQLMITNERDRKENRTLELGAISRSLKALAKDLKIPIIALSQLSRKCEERTDKRPLLSDLRESGALEQDADLVVFIYREEVYKETEQNHGLAELIIAKQRNGPIGTVRLAWIAEETRFANLSDIQEPTDRRLPMADR